MDFALHSTNGYTLGIHPTKGNKADLNTVFTRQWESTNPSNGRKLSSNITLDCKILRNLLNAVDKNDILYIEYLHPPLNTAEVRKNEHE